MIYYLSVAIGHMREMIDRFVVQKIKCVDYFFFPIISEDFSLTIQTLYSITVCTFHAGKENKYYYN